MNRVFGKVIIVTGASSGIGETTARELARRGATVVLAARRKADLDGLAGEINAAGGKTLVVPTDAQKLEDLENLIAVTVAEFGRIDVVFNNAGVGEAGPVAELSEDDLQRLITTNLVAPIRLARAVIPQMKRQGHGQIIITGSVASYVASPGIYGATKFGVRGLADALRRELRSSGIKVSLVSPGFIRTAMTTHVKIPMPGPESVARAVVSVIERPRRQVVVPGFYRGLILLAGAFPWLADAIASRIKL